MRIALAADHAGVELKATLLEHLRTQGHEVSDMGAYDSTSVDFPDYALPLADAVATAEVEFGILICGTGIGMCMAANKRPGARAALCGDTFSARSTRAHNNANILCLGSRVVGAGLALAIVDAFLGGEFEGGRHQRRVDKIDSALPH